MMSAWFLLLTIFSLSVFAQENCAPSNIPQELIPLLEINRYVGWNAASSQEVSRAPCRKGIPAISEMRALINSFATPAQNDVIHGVSLIAERPELISAFRELTTMRNATGTKNYPDGQANLAAYNINPACVKVMCAVEKIWGPSMGPKILYLKLHYDLNTSELSIFNTSRFTEAELNDVMIGLGDLPPRLKNAGRPHQQLVHYARGEMPSIHQGTNTAADSSINLYDRWSNRSGLSRQYVLFHEMAHNISHHLGDLDNSPRFLEMAGWIKTGQEWEKTSEFCAVSNYGSTDPDEDFAETVAAYRYNAATLRDQCPKKYDYMRGMVFAGTEYLDSSSCY